MNLVVFGAAVFMWPHIWNIGRTKTKAGIAALVPNVIALIQPLKDESVMAAKLIPYSQRRAMDEYRANQQRKVRCECTACEADLWGASLMALLWVIAFSLMLVDVILLSINMAV